MQGLVLQLTRAGFLMLLWLFIWSVLRILRTDIYAPTGAVMVRRGLTLRGTLLPSRQRGGRFIFLPAKPSSRAVARPLFQWNVFRRPAATARSVCGEFSFLE